MENHEFCEFLGPAAYDLEVKRGYPMEAVMAQVHLETGGLVSYPAGSNNVLGIKWNGEGGPETYAIAETEEQDEAGNAHTEIARWQKFPSLLACLEHWANMMEYRSYRQAQPYKANWAAFLGMIWYNGEERVYATDAYYLWKAVKRAADVGIPEWCARYRQTRKQPPGQLALNGVTVDGVLRDSHLWVPARPLVDALTATGYTERWDDTTKTLTLMAPMTNTPRRRRPRKECAK